MVQYVKSIELPMTEQYNLNFIKDIQMKIPNLNFIKFTGTSFVPRRQTHVSFASNDERNHTTGILDKLTTIHFSGSIECEKEWLINSLLNLKYLIFSSKELLQ
jgi:hypothetical protein